MTPATFQGVEVGRAYDVAVPMCSYDTLGREKGWLDDGTTWWLTVMARVPSEEPTARANVALAAESPALFEATVPQDYRPAAAKAYRSLRLRAIGGSTGVSALRERYGDPLLLLLTTTALVLLVACTNLANLALARASTREHEFAVTTEFGVRVAFGADRLDIVGLVVREGAVLVGAGLALGSVLAVAGARLARSLVFGVNTYDPRPVALACVLLGAVAVAACVLPARRAARLEPVKALRRE